MKASKKKKEKSIAKCIHAGRHTHTHTHTHTLTHTCTRTHTYINIYVLCMSVFDPRNPYLVVMKLIFAPTPQFHYLRQSWFIGKFGRVVIIEF